ncbi:MAG TPA: SIMPL domain-containing protein [Halobacteria archaeon]|nr:SIMPL domain-containing protein [Halobacteria archaeon]
MRKISNISIVFVVLVALVLVLLSNFVYVLVSDDTDKQRGTIDVEGVGYATAVPDIAELSISVETQDMQLTVAQKEASDIMNSVFKSLNNNGVSDNDIQTIGYSISPIWVWNPDKKISEFKGYGVENDIRVKIRDIERTGDIIDDAVIAGGNNIRIGGINFTVGDFNVYLDKAREDAVINAKNKARMLADMSGVELGSPIRITIDENIPEIRSKSLAFREMSQSTPISAGETSIRVSVNIIYEIN